MSFIFLFSVWDAWVCVWQSHDGNSTHTNSKTDVIWAHVCVCAYVILYECMRNNTLHALIQIRMVCTVILYDFAMPSCSLHFSTCLIALGFLLLLLLLHVEEEKDKWIKKSTNFSSFFFFFFFFSHNLSLWCAVMRWLYTVFALVYRNCKPHPTYFP